MIVEWLHSYQPYVCLPKTEAFWTGAISFGVLCLEAWLGKTNKIKAGSIFEAIYNGVSKVISIFKRSNDPTKENE